MPFIVSRHTRFESRASRRLGGRSLNTGTLHNIALDAVMPLLDEFSSCLESDTTSTYLKIGHSLSRLAVAFFPTTKVHGASETARSSYCVTLSLWSHFIGLTVPKGAWNCHSNQKLLLCSCQIKVKIVASWSAALDLLNGAMAPIVLNDWVCSGWFGVALPPPTPPLV